MLKCNKKIIFFMNIIFKEKSVFLEKHTGTLIFPFFLMGVIRLTDFHTLALYREGETSSSGCSPSYWGVI